MFDGDDAGVRASYKSAIMSLPLISPKKFVQFIVISKSFFLCSYIIFSDDKYCLIVEL